MGYTLHRLENRFDRYLRNPKTRLARGIRKISPESGKPYRNCAQKKLFEMGVGLPAALAGLPAILVLGVLVKLDGGPAFYKDTRINKDNKPFTLYKLRSMKLGSDPDKNTSALAAQYEPEDDPRSTKIGRFMRATDLDELPQIYNVYRKQNHMSLFGIRAVAPYAHDYIKGTILNEELNVWEKAYFEGDPSLFSLHSAISPSRKNERQRIRADKFYAEKASLAFDGYILYRYGKRLVKKVRRKIENTATQISAGDLDSSKSASQASR